MPSSIPSVGSAAIESLVGRTTYLRGMEYAVDDRVDDIEWDAKGRVISALVRGGVYPPYSTGVLLSPSDHPARIVSTWCSCPMEYDCKHVAALLLTAELSGATGDDSDMADAQAWRSALTPLLSRESVARRDAALALQFTILPPLRYSGRLALSHRLGARPVIMGKRERWIHTGVHWTSLGALPADPAQTAALRAVLALFWGSSSIGYAPDWLDVGSINYPLVWEALATAHRSGVQFVVDNAAQSPVEFAPAAQVHVDVGLNESGVHLMPRASIGSRILSHGTFAFVGRPAHGLFAWETDGDGKPSSVSLGPLTEDVPPSILDLAQTGARIVVPPEDVPDFTAEVLPALVATRALVSDDGTFEIPDLPSPLLNVTVQHHGGARLGLAWAWRYVSPGQPESGAPVVPLAADGPTPVYRDTAAEGRVLDGLTWLLIDYPWLTTTAGGRRHLAPTLSLHDADLVAFVREVLPRLRESADVIVHDAGEVIDYAEATTDPTISIATTARPDNSDWFDLDVDLRIDDQAVPFAELFRALADDQQYLVLASGTYFALDRPQLRTLRDLIEEARGLVDRDSRGLRVSRYQADLWQELAELGVVDSQADEWRRAVAGLVGPLPDRDVPEALTATLRAYQQQGYAWLSFLGEHRLGGVLADDMGLGKTLQVIAMVADSRATTNEPFLVVAPTSVMGNWVSECAKFAPNLRATVVAETSARRDRSMADIVAGCDVVVTSYTLFRLDFEAFAEQQWAGLILDEAQFVKNHQSQAHSCARRLRAPVKFAVTGTPLENNLMEFWSLLSIVAPGLFPSPRRFAEYYQRPIEKEGNDDRLAQLRRRVAPFMLRRTKEEVARDLPPKQEQVLEVDLLPAHRKVYQTHLQRERQKVLGLLDDMNANRFEIFRSLTMLRQLALDASLVDDDYARIPSTKLDLLMELLDDAVSEGHRTLVFSQFTSFLAKARTRLDAAGVGYAYLDGATRRRADVIDGFRAGTAPVFLISLKAGGVGLTLTEADYVILLDPWWNPATEAQAVDRAHRIGQDKPVMVYRFVAKDTIEEKVMALKASKAALFDAVVSGTASQSRGLSADDIKELLS